LFSKFTAPVFSQPPRKDPGSFNSFTNLTAELHLTWGSVNNASYIVEYREVGTTRWTRSESLKTNQYILRGKYGVTYEFRVTAIVIQDTTIRNFTANGPIVSGGQGLTTINNVVLPYTNTTVTIIGDARTAKDRLFVRENINPNIRYSEITGGIRNGLPDTGFVSDFDLSLTFNARVIPENPTREQRTVPLAVEGRDSGTYWEITKFTLSNAEPEPGDIITHSQTSEISRGTTAPAQPRIDLHFNEQQQPVITIRIMHPEPNFTDFTFYYYEIGTSEWKVAPGTYNMGENIIDFLESGKEYIINAVTRLEVPFNGNLVSLYSVDGKGDVSPGNEVYIRVPEEPRNPLVDKCNTASDKPILKAGFSINNFFSIVNGAYSVTVQSRIDDYGIPNQLIDYGHYYSDQPDLINRRREDLSRVPTISRTRSSTANPIYESTIVGLKPESTYYVLAFVRNNTGWGYSCRELSFTTPKLEKAKFGNLVVDKISCTGAEFRSIVIDKGFPPLTKKGIEISTSRTFGTVIITLNSTEQGDSYTNIITKLKDSTTYWVRSFAESPAGKSYSEPVEFRTLSNPVFDELPKSPFNEMTLGTPFSSITKHSATATNKLKKFGNEGNYPSQHGHVWLKGRAYPTFKNNDGITDFGVLNNLNPFTSYLGDGSNSPLFKEISCGNGFCSAITQEGYLVTWGNGRNFSISDTPAESGFLKVSCGNLHATAIKADGTLVSWGNYPRTVVLDNPSQGSFEKVSSGNGFSVGLKSDGTLVTWGMNEFLIFKTTPKDNDFVDISSGPPNFCVALKSDGTLVPWGSNTGGIVTNRPKGNEFIKASSGNYHITAIKSDTTLVSWGMDNNGEVSNTPNDGGYLDVSCGYNHCTALKLDGTLVSWGRNVSNVVSSTPKGNGFNKVSCGNGHCTALRADGTLESWGSDIYNQVHATPNYHFNNGNALEMASRYVVRPYAIHVCGITYGPPDVFWTAGLRPDVIMRSVTEITQSSVLATGGVLDLGVPYPFAHGFVYSTQMAKPVLNAVLLEEGIVRRTTLSAKTNYDDFSRELKRLSPGTTYYIRAYLSNTSRPSKNTGTSNSGATAIIYSEVMVFTTEKSDLQKVNEVLENLLLPNVCFISEDLNLPTHFNEASITWESSLPEIVTNQGKVNPPPYTNKGIKVSLRARISLGDITRTKFFNIVVRGNGEFNQLIDLEDGYGYNLCISNWGTAGIAPKVKTTNVDFNGANNQYLLWTIGQEYDVSEKRFPLKHHSGDIRCSWRVTDSKLKIRKWLPMDLIVSFNENSANIVIVPDPFDSFGTGKKTIIHLGSLDQIKNADQTDLRGNFGGFSGSDIPSETPVELYGEVAGNGNTDVVMVYTRGIRPYAKHEVFLEDKDTQKIIIQDNLSSYRGTLKNILLMPNFNGIDGDSILITDSETQEEERYIFYNITIPVTPFENENLKVAIKEEIRSLE
jgi:alpha-tubulin suppressor-like RCC1 family protein